MSHLTQNLLLNLSIHTFFKSEMVEKLPPVRVSRFTHTSRAISLCGNSPGIIECLSKKFFVFLLPFILPGIAVLTSAMYMCST